MGAGNKRAWRVTFNSRLKLEFHVAGQAWALLAAAFLGASISAAQVEVPAAVARVREMGRITPEGAFSFWEDGSIGERFVARMLGTGELRFSARGVAVNGEWPLVAVEITQAESGTREVARISVNSAKLREFHQEIEIPAVPFELRLHELNRSAGPDPKSLRQLLLTKFSLTNVERFDESLLEAALFGAKRVAMASPPRKIRTGHLEVEVWPASAVWRVVDGDLGCHLDTIGPVLDVGGRKIDLGLYRVECVIEEDAGAIIGPATRVALRYRKPGGLEIDYTLWFSHEGHEMVARLDFTSNTGDKVAVIRAAPVVCGSATVGGAVSSWAAVGDAKENSEPHQLVKCGSMQSLEAWWHVAVKNRATGHGLLMGSLTNRKGLGASCCRVGTSTRCIWPGTAITK